jgi:hypothetical protein
MAIFLHIWSRLERTAARLNARWEKTARHLFRWGVPILLLAYLGYSLTQLGWTQIWNGIPSGFGFYVAVLAQFYVQPVADLIIYRYLLDVGIGLPLSVMLRKRYVNAMLDYSGEVYFFFWARKNLNLRKGLLMHAVKDTNVLSASAALASIMLMLALLVVTGGARLPEHWYGGILTVGFVFSLPLILGIVLFAGGRRVSALSRGEIATTFSIHFARCVVKLVLEFSIWWLSGALPSAVACFQFVVLRAVVTRLPLVPNKDLLFVGVGVAAAGLLEVSAPKVAAVLVVMTLINLLQNLMLVGLPWLVEQFQLRKNADQPASGARFPASLSV